MGPMEAAQVSLPQLTRILGTLDHIAMRRTRVAIGATEFAPHVRVNGPIAHPRRLGRVEDGPYRMLIEDRVPGSRIKNGQCVGGLLGLKVVRKGRLRLLWPVRGLTRGR